MIKKFILGLVVVLCFETTVFANNNIYIKDCKIEHKSIKYYEQKVSEVPDNVCSLYNLSVEYGRKNRTQDELNTLLLISEINPKDKDVYFRRAHIYLMYDNSENYYREFARAIKNIPEYSIGHEKIALVYENILDYENALKHINTAIKYSKEPDKYLYFRRGHIYYCMKNYKEAIKDYTKCIDLDSTDSIAYYFRSLCYREIGMFNEAEKDKRTDVQLSKNNNYKRSIFKRINSKFFNLKDRLFYNKELV